MTWVDKRLRSFVIPGLWLNHWNRDYTTATGVARLGYTPIRAVVLVTPRDDGTAEGEMLVECQEGFMSRDEAIGRDWIPTLSEIALAAKQIREENDANGAIRRPDTVGFDLHRVVQRPTLIERVT